MAGRRRAGQGTTQDGTALYVSAAHMPIYARLIDSLAWLYTSQMPAFAVCIMPSECQAQPLQGKSVQPFVN